MLILPPRCSWLLAPANRSTPLSPGFHSHSVEAFASVLEGLVVSAGAAISVTSCCLPQLVNRHALPRPRSHPYKALENVWPKSSLSLELSRSPGGLLCPGRRLRRLLLGAVQRIVNFPSGQQVMHQHSQSPRHRHQYLLLARRLLVRLAGLLLFLFQLVQSPTPQIAVRRSVPEQGVRTLHHQPSQHQIHLLCDALLRVAV